jgi:hypothetical protein
MAIWRHRVPSAPNDRETGRLKTQTSESTAAPRRMTASTPPSRVSHGRNRWLDGFARLGLSSHVALSGGKRRSDSSDPPGTLKGGGRSRVDVCPPGRARISSARGRRSCPKVRTMIPTLSRPIGDFTVADAGNLAVPPQYSMASPPACLAAVNVCGFTLGLLPGDHSNHDCKQRSRVHAAPPGGRRRGFRRGECR